MPDGREDAADEAQEQQDGGKGHAPLGGEEERKAPAGRRDEQRAEEGGPIAVDGRAGALADPLADEPDREQQDRGGDRHENVVEAGDEPELLLVRSRQAPLPFDKGAQCAVAESALIAPAATASSISFWLYMSVLPVRTD